MIVLEVLVKEVEVFVIVVVVEFFTRLVEVFVMVVEFFTVLLIVFVSVVEALVIVLVEFSMEVMVDVSR